MMLKYFENIVIAEKKEEEIQKRKGLFNFKFEAKKNRSLTRAVEEHVKKVKLLKEKVKNNAEGVKKVMRRLIVTLPSILGLKEDSVDNGIISSWDDLEAEILKMQINPKRKMSN